MAQQTFLVKIERSAYSEIIQLPMYTPGKCGKLVAVRLCFQRPRGNTNIARQKINVKDGRPDLEQVNIPE